MKYIYIASENSINEGQGYKDLTLVGTAENWEQGYALMVAIGKTLMADGWIEGCKTRSKEYSHDSYLEANHGQSWMDWHKKEVICSTDELMLSER